MVLITEAVNGPPQKKLVKMFIPSINLGNFQIIVVMQIIYCRVKEVLSFLVGVLFFHIVETSPTIGTHVFVTTTQTRNTLTEEGSAKHVWKRVPRPEVSKLVAPRDKFFFFVAHQYSEIK